MDWAGVVAGIQNLKSTSCVLGESESGVTESGYVLPSKKMRTRAPPMGTVKPSAGQPLETRLVAVISGLTGSVVSLLLLLSAK
jgi:hypothetical protein